MGNYAGQIGFGVILLSFLFYFDTILILGGQISAVFFEHDETCGVDASSRPLNDNGDDNPVEQLVAEVTTDRPTHRNI